MFWHLRMILAYKQARKAPSYASSKLWITDSLTGVKCRATSVAKNCDHLKSEKWGIQGTVGVGRMHLSGLRQLPGKASANGERAMWVSGIHCDEWTVHLIRRWNFVSWLAGCKSSDKMFAPQSCNLCCPMRFNMWNYRGIQEIIRI